MFYCICRFLQIWKFGGNNQDYFQGVYLLPHMYQIFKLLKGKLLKYVPPFLCFTVIIYHNSGNAPAKPLGALKVVGRKIDPPNFQFEF